MLTGKKLTKRYVESVNAVEKQEIILWDSELRGFALRIYPSNRRVYFVQYRNKFGRSHRKTIGVHGVITAEMARDEAKKILGDVAKGEDPANDKKNAKLIPTMEELANEYLDLYAKGSKRPKSLKEDQRMLKSFILKNFGSRPINEVSAHDLCLLHSKLKDTPYQANRVRSLLSKMFNLAIKWGLAVENPAKHVERYQEHEKTRWLDNEEVCKLWAALDQYHNKNVANAIRLLLLTGSRRGEVLNATWDQFDLIKGIWTKPAHTTKQKQMEYLPLSYQAISLLKEMRGDGAASPFLFPGKVPGKPLQEIKNAWATILKLADLKSVRIHDLRHTHASHLVSDGEDLYTVGKLLGHTQLSTTKKYAHLAHQPLKRAAMSFGNKIEKLTTKII